MKEIFIIKVTSFDNAENYQPQYTSIKGFFFSERRAKRYVAKQEAKEKYKGWDGQYYPQYKIEKIKLLKMGKY